MLKKKAVNPNIGLTAIEAHSTFYKMIGLYHM